MTTAITPPNDRALEEAKRQARETDILSAQTAKLTGESSRSKMVVDALSQMSNNSVDSATKVSNAVSKASQGINF